MEQISEQTVVEKITFYKQRQDLTGLTDYIESVLHRSPDELRARLLNELGVASISLEEGQKAQRCFEESLQLRPDNLSARYNFGNLYLYGKKTAEALRHFQLVLELKPDHAGALYNSGLCHMFESRSDEAADCFISVTEIAPDYMGAHFYAGQTFCHTGEFAKALECYEKTLELDPSQDDAVRGVACCLFELGDYRRAMGVCDFLLTHSHSEYLMTKIKGDCHFELGEMDSAAGCYVLLVEMDDEGRAHLLFQAKRLAKEGDREGVKSYGAAVLEYFPEYETTLEEIFSTINQ